MFCPAERIGIDKWERSVLQSSITPFFLICKWKSKASQRIGHLNKPDWPAKGCTLSCKGLKPSKTIYTTQTI